MLQPPIRTCIICRSKSNKKNLIRLTPVKQRLIVDTKQNIGGRGYYICREVKCIEAGLKKKLLRKTIKDDLFLQEALLEQLMVGVAPKNNSSA